MGLMQRLHPEAVRHEATGPIIVDGEILCSTCRTPVRVESPDFDSAELLHIGRYWSGPQDQRPEWLRRAEFNKDLTGTVR
jgi:hypothetical protein